MLPIGDDNSARRIVPVVTYALIAINVLVFLLELTSGQAFIEKWAFVPSRFLADPAAGIPNHLHLHVHAWRVAAPVEQYALPVDLWR